MPVQTAEQYPEEWTVSCNQQQPYYACSGLGWLHNLYIGFAPAIQMFELSHQSRNLHIYTVRSETHDPASLLSLAKSP